MWGHGLRSVRGWSHRIGSRGCGNWRGRKLRLLLWVGGLWVLLIRGRSSSHLLQSIDPAPAGRREVGRDRKGGREGGRERRGGEGGREREKREKE